jgi:hypothetical protein
MSNNFKQGFYTPINKDKYIEPKGKDEVRPYFRSSYEERVFVWADLNKNILRWCSECIVIPYQMMEWSEKYEKHILKKHKYITDLYCEIKDSKGQITKWLIEVKPLKQTLEPKQPKRKTEKALRRYIAEQAIYQKNTAKWAAAKQYALDHGMNFKILTETEIFNK